MTHINPFTDIGADFLSVQNPIQYVGGEFGQTIKSDDEVDFTFAMAFPDTYEIGMSNSAVKIIYQGINNYKNMRCERVFCPDTDFETLLREKHIPLYTLESGIPLYQTDMIGFSIGYELGITNVLTMLETGGVPLLRGERTEEHPIIMAGGCGVTNPLPYSDFFDAVFIGEAEGGMFDLFERLGELKKSGSTRSELLNCFASHPSVWTPEKKEKGTPVHRAIYAHFADDFADTHTAPCVACFPIPNIRVIQDHGVVEIMRGCPNGCRFCHAGVYYRPQRSKSPKRIIQEVEFLTSKAGYREISLTSLSSGDYEGISELLDTLTDTYSEKNVSFQLPSLKVNTFTLPILEKLSQVRKSGLTFAVETPVDAWQFALNKEVFRERIYDIIMEAKKRGWGKAKFYFMIGLPPSYINQSEENYQEEVEIVNFLLDIQSATRIQCSVNVGSFIPKVHTPYQWAAQITPEEAERKMSFIRKSLPRNLFKVSTHREFNSFLEGIMSRGDERVGKLILNAYRKGCRLDAWEDNIQVDLWKEAIAEADWDVYSETLRERNLNEQLPWQHISLGVSTAFLKREWKRSINSELSKKCSSDCDEKCGICNSVQKIIQQNNNSSETVLKNEHSNVFSSTKVQNNIHQEKNSIPQKRTSGENENIAVLYRVIFSFSKKGAGSLLPHLGIVETFSKSFVRSELPIIYTSGFNPLPRFELAVSMSLGIESESEIASILLRTPIEENEFVRVMNESLPSFLHIDRCFVFAVTNKLKRESLASLLWGADYIYEFINTSFDTEIQTHIQKIIAESGGTLLSFQQDRYPYAHIRLPFKSDRLLRDSLAAFFGFSIYQCLHITKLETLAHSAQVPHLETLAPGSYFDVYTQIAEKNKALIVNQ